jgi:VanZ family protein
MYPIVQSEKQSEFVRHILNQFFSNIGCNIVLSQFAVRKLAHFTEYFFLGILLTFTIRMIHKNLNGLFFLQLFLFLAIPVLDETIQLASNGRNSSVIDVLIDFSGCMVGMGLYRLILCHTHDKKSQHLRKQ